MFLEVDESSLQEFSVQELVGKESTLGSVPPHLCSGGSNSSGSSYKLASAFEFIVTGSTITVNTAELTDISIEELEDDIVSYTNEGNEVRNGSPDDTYDGLFTYFEKQSRMAVQEKKSNEAAEINIWGSEIYQEICDLEARGVPYLP